MRHLLAFILGIATLSLAQESSQFFNRIASFPVSTNLSTDADPTTETSAEIIAATEDGMVLVYSDSPLGAVGMIDISDPNAPKAAGVVTLEGEPTSVTVVANNILAAVNTSESFTEPSGTLAVIDITSKTVTATCDLGGQPDSVAVSGDGSLLAVAIENERDEDTNDGEIPQLPAGTVAMFALENGTPDCDSLRTVDVTGLAEVAAEDPEPEFIDFNDNDELAVTLQENNHIVIINANDGSLVSHFSAGTVDLTGIDTEEDGALTFDSELSAVPREPDAVQWLDTERLVVANEGDYEGGSRGFTIFSKTGEVLFESGASLEYQIALAGHYPEARSDAKGTEPEGLEVRAFGDETYIFILSERGSVIGVYKDTGTEPEFVQLLPSALSPEGGVAIPERDLLAVSNEVDLIADGGVRSHVTLYRYGDDAASYPMIVSDLDENGQPLGWGALSGLVADAEQPGILYGVSDSFYAMQPSIFTIDANQTPARITETLRVTRNGANAQLLDLEGITLDGEGGFWLASEGRTDRLIPHALYHVNAEGEIEEQIAFPAELLAVETRWGAEGITKIGDTLWIAIQRQWGDDPENTVKLVSYNLETEEWGAVRYPTEPIEADGAWVGLSEITAYGDYVYIVERDNLIGEAAQLKKLYRVAISELQAAPLGGDLPLVTKEEVHDFLPDLKATGGYVVDKLEGFAIDVNGNGFAVTDNDGVDDSNGETLFFSIGQMNEM
jgi:hypothetical protein